jgi:hypothetical protein
VKVLPEGTGRQGRRQPRPILHIRPDLPFARPLGTRLWFRCPAEPSRSGSPVRRTVEREITGLNADGIIELTVVRNAINREQDGPDQRPLYARDIAIGVTHRDQRALVHAAADAVCESLDLPAGAIVVDTAKKRQGRQFEVVIAWHPLSGRRDASVFHLEAGRLCVLASRHRQAVIARDGVRQQLDERSPASRSACLTHSRTAVSVRSNPG